MAEYIDRQEVIKKLEELDSRLMRGHYYDECEGVAMAKAIVNGVPAADVKTVVHGRYDGVQEVFCCSVCWYTVEEETPFCPNGGAKMDEEEHNNV